MPLERKREVYSICREFDMLLLEDDPYFYLQFTGVSLALPQHWFMSICRSDRLWDLNTGRTGLALKCQSHVQSNL